ncbi:MAG TPA: gamma carbonic anhydrase family protein [Acidobacteriota bacterium]|nr:gamma carbonic anhydrase family protein [Acidobacteriota bacterium]
MIRPFLDSTPSYDDSNFIAPSAEVIGNVTLGPKASIWFNATVRGDVNWIRIGECSNIQDNAVVHVTKGSAPVQIGRYVTVGHSAIVHGCTIEDLVLVGMGSIILDHAVIGTETIIGAGSLVTSRVEIPPRSLVLGRPAKVVRDLSADEIQSIRGFAENYLKYSSIYRGESTPQANPFY